MFDLAWSEIALIGVVALVVIGPKDLPEAIRGMARGIAKLRRMASEFQSHADDLVREAKLDEVRNQISEIRNFNIRDEIERAVDKDGTIRKTFTEDPLRTDHASGHMPAPPAATEGAGAAPGSGTPGAEPPAIATPAAGEAPATPDAPPAFIPPPDAGPRPEPAIADLPRADPAQPQKI